MRYIRPLVRFLLLIGGIMATAFVVSEPGSQPALSMLGGGLIGMYVVVEETWR